MNATLLVMYQIENFSFSSHETIGVVCELRIAGLKGLSKEVCIVAGNSRTIPSLHATKEPTQ